MLLFVPCAEAGLGRSPECGVAVTIAAADEAHYHGGAVASL